MNKLSIAVTLAAIAGLSAVGAAHAQSWAGGYVGLSAGSNSIDRHNDHIVFDTNLDGKFDDSVPTTSSSDAFSGTCDGFAQGAAQSDGCRKNKHRASLGLRAGYDWQMNDVVFGVVGEVNNAKVEDSVSSFSTEPNSYTFTRKARNLSALRGRIGYASNDWLMYATAGVAWADIHHSFATTNNLNSFTASNSKSNNGYQVGLGVEKKMGDRWSIGLEYLRTSIRDRSPVVRAGSSANTFASNPFLIINSQGTDMKRSDDKFKDNSFMLTVSYRFGAM